MWTLHKKFGGERRMLWRLYGARGAVRAADDGDWWRWGAARGADDGDWWRWVAVKAADDGDWWRWGAVRAAAHRIVSIVKGDSIPLSPKTAELPNSIPKQLNCWCKSHFPNENRQIPMQALSWYMVVSCPSVWIHLSEFFCQLYDIDFRYTDIFHCTSIMGVNEWIYRSSIAYDIVRPSLTNTCIMKVFCCLNRDLFVWQCEKRIETCIFYGLPMPFPREKNLFIWYMKV
jgi:hypothetical protein